jgi:hypothetical protein
MDAERAAAIEGARADIKAREGMTDELTPVHLYVSTACMHSRHLLCRQGCKFCDAACLCPCHVEEDRAQDER